MAEILVLYYSRGGSVARLARQIARGIGEVPGMSARLRTVPPVAAVTQTALPPVPENGAPYVSVADLAEGTGSLMAQPLELSNRLLSLSSDDDACFSHVFSRSTPPTLLLPLTAPLQTFPARLTVSLAACA